MAQKQKRVFILGGGAALGAHHVGALRFSRSKASSPTRSSAARSASSTRAATSRAACRSSRRRGTSSTRSRASSRRASGTTRSSGTRSSRWTGCRGAIEEHIDFPKIFESRIELEFVLLNVSRGRGEVYSKRDCTDWRDLRTLSRAGYAIPLLFPPVQFRKRLVRRRRLRLEHPARARARARRDRDLPRCAPIASQLPYQGRFGGMLRLRAALHRRHVADDRQHGLPLRAHGERPPPRRAGDRHRARRAVQRLRSARRLQRVPAEEPRAHGRRLSRRQARDGDAQAHGSAVRRAGSPPRSTAAAGERRARSHASGGKVVAIPPDRALAARGWSPRRVRTFAISRALSRPAIVTRNEAWRRLAENGQFEAGPGSRRDGGGPSGLERAAAGPWYVATASRPRVGGEVTALAMTRNWSRRIASSSPTARALRDDSPPTMRASANRSSSASCEAARPRALILWRERSRHRCRFSPRPFDEKASHWTKGDDMAQTMIFVVPALVRDLGRSMRFLAGSGFGFNPQFTGRHRRLVHGDRRPAHLC